MAKLLKKTYILVEYCKGRMTSDRLVNQADKTEALRAGWLLLKIKSSHSYELRKGRLRYIVVVKLSQI